MALSWAKCKQAISGWEQPQVLALLQDLYKLSDDNRRFLHARLLPESAEASVAEVEKKLRKLLSVSAMFNERFDPREIQRVVDEFAKATGNDSAVAGLLLANLEIGLQTFSEIGDFEELVDHLYSTMGRLEKVLSDIPRNEVGPLIERLSALARQCSGRFGYGLGDELLSMAGQWEERLISADRDAT